MAKNIDITRQNDEHNSSNKIRPTVLISGLIAADLMFKLDVMPKLPEKYLASDAMLGVGGGGANAAIALQRLGGQALLCGRVGDDYLGNLVMQSLINEQVNCKRVQRREFAKTAVSSIFIDAEGERQIVNYRGGISDSLSPLKPKHPPVRNESSELLAEPASNCSNVDRFKLEQLEQCKAVLVDTRCLDDALMVLGIADKLGLPAVVDAEAPTSVEAMALATHIAFSRQGLRDYAGISDIKAGLQRAHDEFDCWVCVTDGADGVYYLSDGCLLQIAAFKVGVVDSLGAGDVWHAAFTLQLACGFEELAAINYANAAAAIKCTQFGGSKAAPRASEIEAFLNENQYR